MIKIDEYRYKAEEGKFITKKSDGFIMGESICLGDEDSIENYDEVEYTEESYKEFYEGIGQPIVEKEEVEKDAISKSKKKRS